MRHHSAPLLLALAATVSFAVTPTASALEISAPRNTVLHHESLELSARDGQTDVSTRVSWRVEPAGAAKITSDGRLIASSGWWGMLGVSASLGSETTPTLPITVLSATLEDEIGTGALLWNVRGTGYVAGSLRTEADGSRTVAAVDFATTSGGGQVELYRTLPTAESWLRVDELRLDARAEGAPVDLCLVTKNGPSWTWTQHGDCRELATSWTAGVALPHDGYGTAFADEVREIVLKLWISDAATGTVRVDKIRTQGGFVHGVNLAWLGGAYDHDFGPNPHHPTWGTAFDRRKLETMFAAAAELGVRVMRVWMFEGCEGFLRDERKQITGLDPTFLANVDVLVREMAPRFRIELYLTLLSSAHVWADAEAQEPNLITDVAARQAYLDRALGPFVARYADSPWVFAIDLANEAEAAVGGTSGNWSSGVTWEQMRAFIQAGARKAHDVAPAMRVSSSSGWHDFENVRGGDAALEDPFSTLRAGRFTGLGLDFYDVHTYRDTAIIPRVRDLHLDRPVLLGEVGQASSTRDDELQRSAYASAVGDAYRLGYWGVLGWYLDYPGSTNEHAFFHSSSTWQDLQPRPITGELADFAATHTDLRP